MIVASRANRSRPVALATTLLKWAFFGRGHGRNHGRDLLFAEAARQVHAQGWQDATFHADNLVTAGNLRLYCPEATVTSSDMPLLPMTADRGRTRILAWNATLANNPAAARLVASFGLEEAMATPQVRQVILPRQDLHPRFRRLAFYELTGP